MSDQTKGYGNRKPILRGDPLRNKIVIARRTMVEQFPFFGYIAMHLEPLETEEVPTMAVTSDKKFLVNRKFADSITEKELMWGIAHEAMHLVTESTGRFPTRGNKTLWNFATDIANNYLLSNPEKGAGLPVPSFNPLYNGFEKYWGKTAEAIYYDMLQENFTLGCNKCEGSGEDGEKEQEGSGAGDSGHGDHSEGKCKHWYDDSGSRCSEATQEDREVWKRIVQQAAEQARQAGNLPGALGEFITELSQPKKDWRRELQYYVSVFCKRRYDWKIRNRRTVASRIITPGYSPFLPRGIVGMDTSGSMSDDDIRKCINEHAGILAVAGGEGKLGLFDAELYYFGDVSIQAITRLPVQRGGTDFRPFFEMVDKEQEKPAYVVVFTDLMGPFPTEAPEYPVIFCVPKGTSSEHFPWNSARVIEIDIC